jgi:muconolactone delta-isomerase
VPSADEVAYGASGRIAERSAAVPTVATRGDGSQLSVPAGTAQAEVEARGRAEATAAAQLANEGHLVRVWSTTSKTGDPSVIGLYRAESLRELVDLLRRLPLYEWMRVQVTPLQTHPNDPAIAGTAA